ncbi:MAG: hypothetical protein NZ898_10365, partial [Myxococcota bacterium]|nr:hypothetical protein [Myxococcota bacterium]
MSVPPPVADRARVRARASCSRRGLDLVGALVACALLVLSPCAEAPAAPAQARVTVEGVAAVVDDGRAQPAIVLRSDVVLRAALERAAAAPASAEPWHEVDSEQYRRALDLVVADVSLAREA